MKLHKLLLSCLALVACCMGISSSADAQSQSFAFTFTSFSYGYTVNGTLDATANGNGSYTATNGVLYVPSSLPAGAAFQSGIYTLLPPNSYADNDNLLFPGQNPVVNENGLSFGNVGMIYSFNLYAIGVYVLLDSNGTTDYGALSLNPFAYIQASSSGLVYNRGTMLYNGTLTITNVSGQAINGTLAVVLSGLTPGVTLVNATGTSNGELYITQTLTGFAAGASIKLPVQFSDPSNARIGYSVFAVDVANSGS